MSIPQTVRASKAVAQAEHYSGELTLVQLKRLAQTAGNEGRVHADWRAGRDDAGHPQLRGYVHGSVRLVCQRCLQPFDWQVDLETHLHLVQSDAEAAGLLPHCEPYEVHEDLLPLHDMTEDEVLLALPLMPRCKTCENAVERATSAAPDEAKSPNPFAALKKLKF